MSTSTGVTANTDGSVTVRFDMNDAGESGIRDAKIVAVLEDNPGAMRQDDILASGTVGQSTVVLSVPPHQLGSGRTATFADGSLEYRSKYHFYMACVDNQGWYNSPPGSATLLNTPGSVTGVPIQNNGGMVYDPNPPSMTVSDIRARTDGGVELSYDVSEIGNSGLVSAKVVASASPLSRDQVFAATGDHTHDVKKSVEDDRGDSVNFTGYGKGIVLKGLTDYRTYRVYYAAKDLQGWYDNGSFANSEAYSQPISNNNGKTWDTVAPVMTYQSNSFQNAGNNTLRVGVTVNDSGNSGIYRATILLKRADANAPLSQEHILDGSDGSDGNGISEKRQHVFTDTNANYTNSATIYKDFVLSEYTRYFVYVAVRDNQGNYDGSLATRRGGNDYSPVHNPRNVYGVAITNGGRTYDNTPPVVYTDSIGGGSLLMPSSPDGRTAIVKWRDAADPSPQSPGGVPSGLKRVWVMVTTSGGDMSAATIAGQAAANDDRRFSSSTSGTGDLQISNLRLGSDVYGWVVAEDNAGNYSAPKRTSPTTISLDSEGPVVTSNGGSQTASAVTLGYKVTDNATGFKSYRYRVSTSGYEDPASQPLISRNIAQASMPNGHTFNLPVPISTTGYSDMQDVYVTMYAYDYVGNRSARHDRSFRVWDRTAPTISTWNVTANNSNRKLTVQWGVSDGRGISSVVVSGAGYGADGTYTNTSATKTTTNSLSPGLYTPTVTVSDNASGASGTFLTTPPNNSASRNNKSAHVMTMSLMSPSTGQLRVSYSLGSGRSGTVSQTSSRPLNGFNGNVSGSGALTVAGASDGPYSFRLASQHTSDSKDVSFTVPGRAPAVSSLQKGTTAATTNTVFVSVSTTDNGSYYNIDKTYIGIYPSSITSRSVSTFHNSRTALITINGGSATNLSIGSLDEFSTYSAFAYCSTTYPRNSAVSSRLLLSTTARAPVLEEVSVSGGWQTGPQYNVTAYFKVSSGYSGETFDIHAYTSTSGTQMTQANLSGRPKLYTSVPVNSDKSIGKKAQPSDPSVTFSILAVGRTTGIESAPIYITKSVPAAPNPVVASFSATAVPNQMKIRFAYRVQDTGGKLSSVAMHVGASSVKTDAFSNSSDSGSKTYDHAVAAGVYSCHIVATSTADGVSFTATSATVSVTIQPPTESLWNPTVTGNMNDVYGNFFLGPNASTAYGGNNYKPIDDFKVVTFGSPLQATYASDGLSVNGQLVGLIGLQGRDMRGWFVELKPNSVPEKTQMTLTLYRGQVNQYPSNDDRIFFSLSEAQVPYVGYGPAISIRWSENYQTYGPMIAVDTPSNPVYRLTVNANGEIFFWNGQTTYTLQENYAFDTLQGDTSFAGAPNAYNEPRESAIVFAMKGSYRQIRLLEQNVYLDSAGNLQFR